MLENEKISEYRYNIFMVNCLWHSMDTFQQGIDGVKATVVN